ncbi:hypothetical protein [Burkholderia dolosa]|uniref:hypothetical protein n=1 Tax=Burkholderia dolosa TaxID=152500 RepID=UPI0027D2ED88|nr:hypothetical protein [Burkholderia dolosa]
MKKILIGAAGLLVSGTALCATMIPSSMINWVSVPTWPSVSAGMVFAGPTATTGAPTFRALVATDLPVVPVSKGGTNTTAAGGAALDNITGFSGTGFLKRTGGGAYAFVTDPLPVANGGTGATTTAAARSALGAASSGANTDITSLSAPALGAATATTATAGDNTTKVATTAYVQTALTGGGNTASFTTVNASGLITPSSTVGVKATATNDNAQAGSIGEQQNAQTTLASVTSNTLTNYASKALTAGDWRCQGVVDYVPAGGTTVSQMLQGVTTTSAASAPFGAGTYYGYAGPAGAEQAHMTPVVRVQMASSGTAYLTGLVIFAGGTLQARGSIDCWRPR